MFHCYSVLCEVRGKYLASFLFYNFILKEHRMLFSKCLSFILKCHTLSWKCYAFIFKILKMCPSSLTVISSLAFTTTLQKRLTTWTQRWLSCVSTSACWPSSSPSCLEFRTPADRTTLRWRSTKQTTSSPTLMSAWSQTEARARQWRLCFTSSCWPPSCGTVCTALRWCCWQAKKRTVDFLHTGV